MSAVRNLLLVMLAAVWTSAAAHRPSDAFLSLRLEGAALSGQWELALRDVDALVPVDRDRDRRVTWGELRAAEPQLAAVVAQALAAEADGQPCTLHLAGLRVHARSDGRYAWLDLRGECPQRPARLMLRYSALFELDPTHRGLLVLEAGGQTSTAVFAPEAAAREFVIGEFAPGQVLLDYLREGVHHIWIGWDHLLFLLVLLLPAVLVWRDRAWQPVTGLRAALWPVAGTVTAFTLAHSVTLALSVMDLVRPPIAAVEVAIAASVMLAALNNLWPLVSRRHWLLAFGFGLIHGFGFAAVLGELGLPTATRSLALIGFNLGVEIGQLAVVAVAVPLAYVARRHRLYRPVVLRGGSLLAVVVAGWWLLDRLGAWGG